MEAGETFDYHDTIDFSAGGGVWIIESVPSTPSLLGALVASDREASGAPEVNFNPGDNPDIVALQLDDSGEKFKESSSPQPDVLRGDYTQTWFDVVTYSKIDGNSVFLRREEFVAVSCKCELRSDPEAGGRRPTLWNGKGEFDWIIMDPDIDFRALFDQFDTILMGRRTFEGLKGGNGGGMPKMKTFVFSQTLRQGDHPEVTIVSENPRETVAALRSAPGKDIWLFGGGLLFRSLAGMGLVDTIEVAIIPVLFGGGTPLLPPPAGRFQLTLTDHRVYTKTGIVSLEYPLKPGATRAARTSRSSARGQRR